MLIKNIVNKKRRPALGKAVDQRWSNMKKKKKRKKMAILK